MVYIGPGSLRRSFDVDLETIHERLDALEEHGDGCLEGFQLRGDLLPRAVLRVSLERIPREVGEAHPERRRLEASLGGKLRVDSKRHVNALRLLNLSFHCCDLLYSGLTCTVIRGLRSSEGGG